MKKISRPPSQQGYTVDLRPASVLTDLRGGLSRARKDMAAPAHMASTPYTVSVPEAEAFAAFYDRVAMTGEAFQSDLLIGTFALEPHVCRMVPGSFEIRRLNGASARVSFQVQVDPSGAFTEAGDNALMDFFESYAETGAEVLNLLAVLVNEDLPN